VLVSSGLRSALSVTACGLSRVSHGGVSSSEASRAVFGLTCRGLGLAEVFETEILSFVFGSVQHAMLAPQGSLFLWRGLCVLQLYL